MNKQFERQQGLNTKPVNHATYFNVSDSSYYLKHPNGWKLAPCIHKEDKGNECGVTSRVYRFIKKRRHNAEECFYR